MATRLLLIITDVMYYIQRVKRISGLVVCKSLKTVWFSNWVRSLDQWTVFWWNFNCLCPTVPSCCVLNSSDTRFCRYLCCSFAWVSVCLSVTVVVLLISVQSTMSIFTVHVQSSQSTENRSVSEKHSLDQRLTSKFCQKNVPHPWIPVGLLIGIRNCFDQWVMAMIVQSNRQEATDDGANSTDVDRLSMKYYSCGEDLPTTVQLIRRTFQSKKSRHNLFLGGGTR